jgi:energy-coupling factor transporter ATP-binding protein EcfA2/DNA repair exonuclease SbcCD nuclease subunit
MAKSIGSRNLLVTGDWHIDTGNLPLIDRMTKELVHVGRSNGVETLIVVGDIKHAFSPVALSVEKKAIETFQELAKNFLQVCVILGNHDYATPHGGDSWRELIKASAPNVSFMEDGRIQTIHGLNCGFVGYQHSAARMQQFVETLKAEKLDYVFFHQAVKGGLMNVTKTSDHGVDPDAFGCISIGGHFHGQQQIGENTYYCGSPFAHSRGEVNQTKGYILVHNGKPILVQSDLPHIVDPSLPSFRKGLLTEGSTIRLTVDYDAAQPPTAEEIAKIKEETSLQSGCPVEIRLRMLDEDQIREMATPGSDEDALKVFLETIPVEYHAEVSKAVTDALKGLYSPARAHLDVISLRCENFLCFKELSFDFTEGQHVLTGFNGQGKSSVTQLIPAVLFGETSKGQKSTRLRREGSTGPSWGEIKIRLKDGRVLTVTRRRHPKLEFTAVASDGQSYEEKEISKLLGMTMEVMFASLFVDQINVAGLLGGKPSEQRDIMNAFCGSDRYADAFKILQEEESREKRELTNVEWQLRNAESTIAADIRMCEEVTRHNAEVDKRNAERSASNISRLEATYKEIEELRVHEKANMESLSQWTSAQADAQSRMKAAELESSRIRTEILQTKGKASSLRHRKNHISTHCPTCGSPTDAEKVRMIEQANAKLEEEAKAVEAQVLGMEHEYAAKVAGESALTATLNEANRNVGKIQGNLREIGGSIRTLNTIAHSLKLMAEAPLEPYRPMPDTSKHEEILSFAKSELDRQKRRVQVCIYAAEATHPIKGIPAMLTRSIIPALNAVSASVSAKMGTDISVSFQADKNSIKATVSNPSGGSHLEDLSCGEKRIASLITTLTVRDLIDSNILILDEPTLGLDYQKSKGFAELVEHLKSSYRTIITISHDSNFTQYLEGEVWRLTKNADGSIMEKDGAEQPPPPTPPEKPKRKKK